MNENELTKQESSELAVVEVTKDGMLAPKNMAGLWRVATAFVKSGLLPNHFNTTEKAFVGLQVCSELGIKPITGMKHLYIVNGSPALYGDLPLAMVLSSGHLDYIKESIVDADMNEICLKNKNLKAKPYASICIGKRKGGEEKEYSFTIDQAQEAGLFKNHVWKVYTRDMLMFKSRTRFLRSNFSDVLLGIPLMESDFDILPEKQNMKDITPEMIINPTNEVFTNPTDKINNELKKKTTTKKKKDAEPKKDVSMVSHIVAEISAIDKLNELYNFKTGFEKQKDSPDKEIILAAISDRQVELEAKKANESDDSFDEPVFDL